VETTRPSRTTFRALAGVLLVAFGLRTALIATGQRYLRSDEAVVGLMSEHILTRGERPLFLYGQPYGGGHAIVAYLTAPLFAAFGRSGAILTGVSAALSLVCAGLAWSALRRISDAWTATAGALLYACSPPVVYQSVLVNGGNACFALALGALLCFLRTLEHERRGQLWAGLAGALSGLACYAMDYALVYPVAFCLLWAFAGGRRKWMHIALFAGAFALGCLPMIAYDLTHHFAHARHMLGGGAGAEVGLLRRFPASLGFALTRGLAAFFSGELDDFKPEAIGPGAWLHAATALAAATWLAVRGRGEIASALRRASRRGDDRSAPPLWLIPTVFIAVYLGMYATAGFSLNRTPRYLLPLCPFLSMAIAQAAVWERRGWRRAAGTALVALLIARGIWISAAVGTRDWHEEHRIRTSGPEVRLLARRLRERGIRTVITPYEVQWRLLFETDDEETIAASDLLSGLPRYPLYGEKLRERLDGGEAAALVLRSDLAFAKLWARHPPQLLGLRLDAVTLSGKAERMDGRYDRFVIFYPLTKADLRRMGAR